MIDRLGEVIQHAERMVEVHPVVEEQNALLDADLMEYVAQVQLIQKYTEDIEGCTLRMKQLKEEMNLAIGVREKEICREVENLMENVLICQKKGNAVLKLIGDKLTEAKLKDPEGENSETRIKQNLLGAESKRFGDSINGFEDVEADIKNQMQNKVLREAEIILNRKVDSSERQLILEDHNYVQKLMSDKLTGAGHIKLQNAVSDIEDRYKDIVKLENGVNQIHKLFVEMALLVKHQGEMIDNIEQNVKTAKGHVLKAEKELVQAKKNIISARKKKCIILIIVIVVLLVIILPILGVKYF